MTTTKEIEVAKGVAEVLAHGTLLEDAVVLSAYWYHMYERSNPDVGMGPMLQSQVQDIIDQLKVNRVLDSQVVTERVRKLLGEESWM